jgi:hypothetical protein
MVYSVANPIVFKIALMKHKNYISLFLGLLLGQLSLPFALHSKQKPTDAQNK